MDNNTDVKFYALLKASLPTAPKVDGAFYFCKDTDEMYIYEGSVESGSFHYLGKQSDWNQNNPEVGDYIKNRTHWKEIVGTDYSSDMDFTQLYYGVNTDDGGKMDHFDYGYARFDVVNQDPEAFIDRSFHRDSTGDPFEGKIEWYDEVETGWFEMYGDGHLIAVLVTDDYNPQSVQFYTVDENGFPVDFTTTPGLYVVNAINGSVEDGEILGLFDFFIDHETIYHTIGKEYLPPVEWDEILNKTHGIEETTGETIVVEASEFTDDDEFCTATFADSYTTCYRKFGLIYEDGWVDEWYGSLKLLKAGETEFIDCSDGIPMFEAGDLLLFGNPHLYDSTFEDNGELYVAYELVSNQDNHWNIKIDSEFAWLEELTEMDIQDIANIKKLDKVYLPSDTVYQHDLAPVATSNDYNDLDNKPTIPVQPTKTSDLINDGNGDSPSNPFVTENDLEAVQDLISTEASEQNKLISQSEAEEMVQTLSLSPIVADNTGTKSFDFESVMYSSMVPDSTNLEVGPWYKNEGSGFVECGSTSGVYVGLNDSTVVLNDESLFYYFAHGYRYQRIKIGVVGVYGKIRTPYGENVDLIYSDGTGLSGKFAGVPCIYFYDDHNQFGHNSRVIYVCRVSNLVSKTNAAEEYLMANTTDTINDIAAGTDPDATYDIIYPTTKYVCTQAQTASSDPVWTYLFTVNDTTFSNEEWAVLKSKATREKIGQIETNRQAIEGLADVARSGSYNDLNDTPSIPTKTSDLVNDGEGDSPLNPYIKSSDLVAGQSDLDYIMGN